MKGQHAVTSNRQPPPSLSNCLCLLSQVAIGPGTGPDPYAALRQMPAAAIDPTESELVGFSLK